MWAGDAFSGMVKIEEMLRLPSPAPRPQALAHDGETLWMGSLATNRVYAIDPTHWTVKEEMSAPGPTFGMTVVGDELRVLLEDGEERRVIRQYIPGHGFRSNHVIACPDNTGSQLGFDGERLYVSQWYNKKVLAIDDNGTVGKVITSPHGICGQVFVNGCFYLMTTDNEDTNDFYITRIDMRGDTPKVEDVAQVPFQARALAFDGQRFWTNHREAHEIVAFTIPGLTV